MPIFSDETGKRYNKLTVISLGKRQRVGYFWNCICDCGNKTEVLGSRLRNGVTKSCGCFALHMRSAMAIARHEELHDNKSKHPLYKIWYNMHYRCSNKKHNQYKDYGGRGIKVCVEWKNFWIFVKDMGPRPSKQHTLDRKNNNGNYEKTNCKWSDWFEQAGNRKSRVYTQMRDRA